MKKLALIFISLFLLSWTPVHAGDSAKTNGKQTANSIVHHGHCVVTFIKLVEAGADSTLTLYDSDTATTSGKTVMDYLEVVNGDGQVGGALSYPLEFDEGVYAVVSGSGAYYFIHVKEN